MQSNVTFESEKLHTSVGRLLGAGHLGADIWAPTFRRTTCERVVKRAPTFRRTTFERVVKRAPTLGAVGVQGIQQSCATEICVVSI